MSKKEYYKTKEQEVLQRLFPKIELEENEYEYWDGFHHQRKWVVELKTRNFTFDEFQRKFNLTPVIEVKKYNNCKQKAEQLDYKFIYIFYFTCGRYVIYNLNDFNSDSFNNIKMMAPENSVSKSSNYILKDFYELPRHTQNNINTYIKL